MTWIELLDKHAGMIVGVAAFCFFFWCIAWAERRSSK